MTPETNPATLATSIAWLSAVVIAAPVFVIAWTHLTGVPMRRAMTMSFVALAFAQLLHPGTARDDRPVPRRARVLANPAALMTVAGVVVRDAMAVYIQPVATFLHIEPLTSGEWLLVAVASGAPGVVGQAVKAARHSRGGVLIGVGLISALGVNGGAFDPLALYTPPGFFSPGTRDRVTAGAAVVDVLPAHGRDLAVFGMARIEAGGDRLVAWTRQIEEFQRGPHMVRARRFSEPPRLEDLDALVVDGGDLDDIRRCRPGDCGLKLGAAEIAQLRRTISVSGKDWRQAVQRQFRQIVLDRAIAYLANGYADLPVYNDHATPVAAGAEFDAVAARVRDGGLHEARLMRYLQGYPWNDRADPDVESFLYWSKESLGSGKPIVSITHVAVLRGREPLRLDAIVASKQVFATHYLLASLSLMAITHPTANGDRYLLYTRQSRVDVFDGALAGLRRRLVERRIRSSAPGVLDAARRRLESGEPPTEAVSSR